MTRLAMASKAAAQFKSPLAMSSEAVLRTGILPTRTIQTLERKLTVLRRAVKIRKDSDEVKLRTLAEKWVEAGREIAYELWDIVKDIDHGKDDFHVSQKNGEVGWGWVDMKETSEERPEPMLDMEDQVKPEETLGLMLKRLGIAPATFGWNEEEEEFVDN